MEKCYKEIIELNDMQTHISKELFWDLWMMKIKNGLLFRGSLNVLKDLNLKVNRTSRMYFNKAYVVIILMFIAFSTYIPIEDRWTPKSPCLLYLKIFESPKEQLTCDRGFKIYQLH